MTTNNPTLRKAAVLISALETDMADTLLEQMGPDQAARVRNAILYLGDVPSAEQEAVLAEFFGTQANASDDDDAVELEMSAASQVASQSYTPARASLPEAEIPQRFAFLELASGEELANGLREEHPQVIAVVATQLTAEKAAELLRYFPAELQNEIIDRIGTGVDAEAEILAEIEAPLRQRFAHWVRMAESNPRRRDHLNAILRHLQTPPVRLSVVNETPVAPEPEVQVPVVTSRESAAVEEPEPAGFDSDEACEFEFDEIQSLSTVDFFAVFEAADSRLVMLALAGAPRRMFDRYVAQFSPERAEEFERHVEQLRPLSLRDVETAQQELAKIADCRLRMAKPAAEKSRKFAVAV
jgi:flagellar motor switch protein FliG